ncbi:LIM domain-binding protein 2-like isoform X1 [Clytia hemisphaerica]|uniref:LIM interaction domain-containing protein n=2 Tax=Clytia hemisphaerica TaxID=252671 RepID=A0A7M5VDU9_9CNID
MLRRGSMPSALHSQSIQPNWPMKQKFRGKRQPAYYLQPDYRIHEFNKRLQGQSDKNDQTWWDELINEFFEEDASLLIQYKEKNHNKKLMIHRRLIPRYFRSLFEGGVSKIYYVVLESKESYMNATVSVDCKHASMITHFDQPKNLKVHTDGHLTIEFAFDSFMRIRHWKFIVKDTTEYLPKSSFNEKDESKAEEMAKNVMEHGQPPKSLHYLRVGTVLESMFEMMARAKSGTMTPREALKSVLYDKWQATMLKMEFETRHRIWNQNTQSRPNNKKRKNRKTPSVSNEPKPPPKKKSPSTSAFPPMSTSDVMFVDEPVLMGGELGDDDERVITRLENAQFDTPNGMVPGTGPGGPTDDIDDAFAPSGGIDPSLMGDSQPWKNEVKPQLPPPNQMVTQSMSQVMSQSMAHMAAAVSQHQQNMNNAQSMGQAMIHHHQQQQQQQQQANQQQQNHNQQQQQQQVNNAQQQNQQQQQPQQQGQPPQQQQNQNPNQQNQQVAQIKTEDQNS